MNPLSNVREVESGGLVEARVSTPLDDPTNIQHILNNPETISVFNRFMAAQAEVIQNQHNVGSPQNSAAARNVALLGTSFPENPLAYLLGGQPNPHNEIIKLRNPFWELIYY